METVQTASSAGTVIGWIVHGLGGLAMLVFSILWKTLTERVVSLERKVNDGFTNEMQQLRISVTQLAGQIQLTNTQLSNLDKQLNEKVESSERAIDQRLTQAIISAFSNPTVLMLLRDTAHQAQMVSQINTSVPK